MDTSFRVGSVLSKSFDVWTENILVFGLIFVVGWAPVFIFGLMTGVITTSASDLQSDLSSADILPLILHTLVSLLAYSLIYGASSLGTVQALQGYRPNIGECLGHGFSVMFPVFLVNLLISFIVMFGMLLLIIPGLVIMVVYAVCAPVAALERTGISETLSRGAQLSKGNRWGIFGIFLIHLASVLVFYSVIEILPFIAGSAGATLAVILEFIIDVALGSFFAVVWCVTYYDLRTAKEGIDVSKTAAVFE